MTIKEFLPFLNDEENVMIFSDLGSIGYEGILKYGKGYILKNYGDYKIETMQSDITSAEDGVSKLLSTSSEIEDIYDILTPQLLIFCKPKQEE